MIRSLCTALVLALAISPVLAGCSVDATEPAPENQPAPSSEQAPPVDTNTVETKSCPQPQKAPTGCPVWSCVRQGFPLCTVCTCHWD